MGMTESRLHAFGKACHLIIDDSNGQGAEFVELCYNELARLERKFSSNLPESLISRINQSAGTGRFVQLDAEARSLFQFIAALWEESKHVFDPTTRVLCECYGENGTLHVSKAQLQQALTLVGWRNLELAPEGARLSGEGMMICLNTCVRPYALDSLRRLLLRNGASNAYIELGQDAVSIGKQPDGANWLAGVRIPRNSRAAIVRLKLNNKGFAMRGNFEQASMEHGERFGSALSPVDGQPIPGLLCVAVIADNCQTAFSAVSMARFKTESTAIRWLDNLGLPWMVIDRQLNCHGPLANGI